MRSKMYLHTTTQTRLRKRTDFADVPTLAGAAIIGKIGKALKTIAYLINTGSEGTRR